VRRRLAAAVFATLALTAAAPAGAAAPMTGDEVIAALKERRLSLSGAHIDGDVDFRAIDGMRHAFSCTSCVISGAVRGDDVVFAATLDLSGTRIEGPVSMRRATFRGPVVFAPTGRGPASFERRADFTFARFGDLATFAGASFGRSADFTAARFGGEAVFAGAEFGREAVFERAAAQADADFSDAEFRGPARFDAAELDGLADFSDALFEAETGFTGARFDRDATFVGATFSSGASDAFDVRFDHASIGRDLLFDLAAFSGRTNFRRTTAGGVLSFDRADFSPPPGKQFVFTDVAAKGLRMDVDAARDVVQRSDREEVLGLIETGAKTRGDLGVANDARFALEVMKSHRQPWWKRIPNVVFFRVVAGYFVRPFHPIVALVLLVAIVALVRVGRAAAGSFRRTTSRFAHEFLDGLALILPGGDDGGRRLEALAYRVLVVCALIGLANSNPTLREMFDALV
jgi:hypothetical protein